MSNMSKHRLHNTYPATVVITSYAYRFCFSYVLYRVEDCLLNGLRNRHLTGLGFIGIFHAVFTFITGQTVALGASELKRFVTVKLPASSIITQFFTCWHWSAY